MKVFNEEKQIYVNRSAMLIGKYCRILRTVSGLKDKKKERPSCSRSSRFCFARLRTSLYSRVCRRTRVDVIQRRFWRGSEDGVQSVSRGLLKLQWWPPGKRKGPPKWWAKELLVVAVLSIKLTYMVYFEQVRGSLAYCKSLPRGSPSLATGICWGMTWDWCWYSLGPLLLFIWCRGPKAGLRHERGFTSPLGHSFLCISLLCSLFRREKISNIPMIVLVRTIWLQYCMSVWNQILMTQN
mgnify:CR=1 FL=1